MSADLRFRQAEAIFYEALELPVDDRSALVQTRTTGDPALLTEVSSLLDAYEQQEQLRRPLDPPPTLQPSQRIGPYELDRLIGKGGMGAVYLAHRQDGEFEQQVAIKLIALPLATEYFRERFRRERQILASLDHPNITRLIDGGVTPQGDPYLVMEYVKGEPLDRHCDQLRVSAPDRIRLFLQVLNAVQYAHRHLVVHGDLKPSNILVTGEGVVKVVDFGTSRFLDEEVKTLTAAAMTPRYASPEQLRGEQLTTASDVFSLGMILYEALTGGSPFRTSGSLLAVFERAVHDTQPMDPAAAVTEEAARFRNASPAELRYFLQSDLSSILSKALSCDSAQRYQFVSDFESDLENHRLARPVLARRQTFVYRTTKFLKRHRGAAAFAALALVVLAAIGIYAFQEQRNALEEGRRARVLNTFLMRLFQSINPAYGGRWDMMPSELIDRAAVQATDMLANEPAARAQFLVSVGGNMILTKGTFPAIAVYQKAAEAAFQSGDVGLEAATQAYLGYLEAGANNCSAARQFMDKAEKIRTAHERTISREWRFYSLINEANTGLLCAGDLRQVRRKSLDALALAREIPDKSLDEGTPPRTMKAAALILAGQTQGCGRQEPFFDEVLAMTKGDPALAGQEAFALFSSAACSVSRGDYTRSLPALQRATDSAVQVWGKASDITKEFQSVRAYTLAESGLVQEAITEARAGVDHLQCTIPFVCRAASSFAMEALMTSGDFEQALPLARYLAASDDRTTIVGKTGLFVAFTQSNQKDAARPYRDAAEKIAASLPQGKWRSRIENALSR